MDSCSAKHCMMAGAISGKLIPSFRSQIGHDGDQICNIHHFAPLSLTPPQLEGRANGGNAISTDHVRRFLF